MILQDVDRVDQPTALHTPGITPHLTGDKLVDATALRLYQGTPIGVRSADRQGVWRQCVDIARTLSRKGAKQ
ncbi:hypothetical protein KOR34_45410 [Posidoniimonas corsicana]|uniref:Uncharacterized protein n=1 Tax=Posidoniimonas corsicana TaxID=1938618 RepID=A0A5C5V0B3_9BACT|nr:hypothetical protein [Posidoniimonas corsicana]TWT31165.1 hypothetical protein KOR34_45410 [Posidoniimonas corsicana]